MKKTLCKRFSFVLAAILIVSMFGTSVFGDDRSIAATLYYVYVPCL
jgi:hypothetical protein